MNAAADPLRDWLNRTYGPGEWTGDLYACKSPIPGDGSIAFRIRADGSWIRGAGGSGNSGSIIDLLVRARGMTPAQAERWLAAQVSGETVEEDPLDAIEAEARHRIPKALQRAPDRDDIGNGQIFQDLYQGSAGWVTGRHWTIYVVRLGLWKPDATGEHGRRLAQAVATVRKELVNHAGEKAAWTHAAYTASKRGIENLLSLAAVQPGMLLEPSRFDRDRDAVLAANGVRIDLRDGSTRPARPEDYFTKALGAPFVAGAQAQHWTAFLEEILPDPEVRIFLQTWVGYALTGHTSESVLVVFVGVGANGKSVTINVLLRLAGSTGRALSPEVLVPEDRKAPAPHELAELEGLRLAVFSETSEGAWLNASAIKRTTSEDDIAACRKYQAPFSFKPTHTPVILTNHLPRVRSTDEGTWRRILVVRFPVTIPEERRDQGLTDRLIVELPGILNWAVEGSVRWYREGLKRPRSVQLETGSYRDGEDLFGSWVGGQIQAPDQTAPASKLMDLYRAWSEAEGVKPLSAQAFKRELLARGFGHGRTNTGAVFTGIGLEPSPSDGDPSLAGKKPHAREMGNFTASDTDPSPNAESPARPSRNPLPELPEEAVRAASSPWGMF